MTADRIYRRKLRDLMPDPRNLNKGTVRGLAMLDDSIHEDGIGRGILLDQQNRIVAGNKTVERLVDQGFEDVLIVPTDGKTLVATQRVDVSLDTPQGKRMALRDNRVAEVDLAWSGEELAALASDGVDLSAFFDDDELAVILNQLNVPDPPLQQEPTLPGEVFIEIYCSKNDLKEFQQTLDEWSKRKGVTVNVS